MPPSIELVHKKIYLQHGSENFFIAHQRVVAEPKARFLKQENTKKIKNQIKKQAKPATLDQPQFLRLRRMQFPQNEQ